MTHEDAIRIARKYHRDITYLVDGRGYTNQQGWWFLSKNRA